MNSNDNINNLEDTPGKNEKSKTLTLDEFFDQLEAKEKDLDISTELIIEIDESDFNSAEVPDYLKPETAAEPINAPATPPPNDYAPNYAANNTELENQIKTLKNQISYIETERGELVETLRRRQNDFENYKKRTERERSENLTNQVGNLATELLPVLDNLNRALDSGAEFSSDKNDFKQFYEGIFLVNQQLNDVLTEMGVQPIISVGEPFDPNFHEAVAIEESSEHPPHTITQELLRGYKVGSKVIRAAMVKVSAASSVKREENLVEAE